MNTKSTVPADPAQKVGLPDSNTSGLAQSPKADPEVAIEKAVNEAAKAQAAAEAEAVKAEKAKAKEKADAEKAKEKAREEEIAGRKDLRKEGKRVFQEEPTGVFDFEPVNADHAPETTVNVRATQRGATE